VLNAEIEAKRLRRGYLDALEVGVHGIEQIVSLLLDDCAAGGSAGDEPGAQVAERGNEVVGSYFLWFLYDTAGAKPRRMVFSVMTRGNRN